MNSSAGHIIKILVMASMLLAGCATRQGEATPNATEAANSNGITYGLIKRDLVVGRSTQEEVIRKFGSPNNMVYHGKGGELWVYDRIQTESTSQFESSRSGLSVGGLAGNSSGGVGVAGGLQNSASTAKNTSIVRTLTVILDFNEKGILVDISARQGGY